MEAIGIGAKPFMLNNMMLSYLKMLRKLFFDQFVYEERKYKRMFPNVDIQKGCIISGECEIGAFSYVGFNTTITKSKIGRYCSIANNVSIGDGEHALSKISTSSIFYKTPYEDLTSKPCIIGNDVWIGTQSIIRRGVKVGNGAVVGANSFVNKDVPDFAIVVGSPAKILKYRFSNPEIEAITNSQWWNLEISDAKEVIDTLQLSLKNL